MAVSALLVGCGRCEALQHVPVEASSGVRALLERELESLSSSFSAEVCVAHVRVGEYNHPGRYNTVSRGIRLDEDVDDDVLVRHLRHEVCHAFDLQNDFSKGYERLFEREFEQYRRANWTKEGFASVCEVGPEGLGWLSALEQCGYYDDYAAYAIVRDEVYRGQVPRPREVSVTKLGAASLPGAVTQVIAHRGKDPAERMAMLKTDLGSFLVDEEHGLLGEWTEDSGFDWSLHWDHTPRFPVPDGWQVGHYGPSSPLDDLQVQTAEFHGGEILRLAVTDGEARWPLPFCRAPASDLLTWEDGELWLFMVNGSTLTWHRLEEG